MGGRYRYCSPVFSLANCDEIAPGRMRPLAMDNLALTNDPRMKTLKPLTNRAGAVAGAKPKTAESAGTKKGKESMNEIAKALGLAETATPEEIMTALQPKLDKLAELEGKEAEATAEADMKPYEGQIANREAVKKILLANREQGLELLKALKPAAAKAAAGTDTTKVLPNRRTAVDPTQTAMSAEKQDGARAAKIRNRAAAIQKEQGCSHSRAWDMAEAENPA
jgi:hypothetical protein